MGRVMTQVRVSNPMDPKYEITFDALVDTGAGPLVLPTAWRERLGKLLTTQRAEVELADQQIVEAEVSGPVEIQLETFRSTYDEVVFLDTKPSNGHYEPLVGHLVLQKSLVAVDMVGHRLVAVKHFDVK